MNMIIKSCKIFFLKISIPLLNERITALQLVLDIVKPFSVVNKMT